MPMVSEVTGRPLGRNSGQRGDAPSRLKASKVIYDRSDVRIVRRGDGLHFGDVFLRDVVFTEPGHDMTDVVAVGAKPGLRGPHCICNCGQNLAVSPAHLDSLAFVIGAFAFNRIEGLASVRTRGVARNEVVRNFVQDAPDLASRLADDVGRRAAATRAGTVERQLKL